jgi:hypothetical protein
MNNLQKVIITLVIFLLPISSGAKVKNQKIIIDENTGVSGTLSPTIPEPLNFDLVRPLGAKKGDVEINVLGLMNINEKEFFNWGPEIEFVIDNGLAMEFELPFANHELEELKFAFQKTFSKNTNKNFIHGLQTIQKVKLHDYFWQSDYLYVHGYKFKKNWSTISLSGFRQNLFNDNYGTSLINNTSIFRAINHKTKVGLESNYRLDSIGQSHQDYSLTILPQIHFELGDHYSLQLGAGATRNDNSWNTILASRLIVEF